MISYIIDPRLGIAGDMFIAALLDFGAPKEKVIMAMETAGSTLDKTHVEVKQAMAGPLFGLRLKVSVETRPDARDSTELRSALDTALQKVELTHPEFPRACLDTLLDAEAEFHKEEDPHLHEMGSGDTLADLVGAAVAVEELGMHDAEVQALPVGVGQGELTFSHGTFEIPAPAVKIILEKNKSAWARGPMEGELATPTGVAILTNLAKSFIQEEPEQKASNVGFGFGTHQYAASTFTRVLKYE